VVGCGVLVGAERLDAGGGRTAGHCGKLLPRDEATSLSQRDQLADLVAVAIVLSGSTMVSRYSD
jgi:hypothetical protein